MWDCLLASPATAPHVSAATTCATTSSVCGPRRPSPWATRLTLTYIYIGALSGTPFVIGFGAFLFKTCAILLDFVHARGQCLWLKEPTFFAKKSIANSHATSLELAQVRRTVPSLDWPGCPASAVRTP